MINALRRTFVRKRNIKGKVEPHAGATRSVQERIKLLDNPLTYCFDTPGITTPSVGEVGTQRWKKLEGPLHRCECSFGRVMLVLSSCPLFIGPQNRRCAWPPVDV